MRTLVHENINTYSIPTYNIDTYPRTHSRTYMQCTQQEQHARSSNDPRPLRRPACRPPPAQRPPRPYASSARQQWGAALEGACSEAPAAAMHLLACLRPRPLCAPWRCLRPRALGRGDHRCPAGRCRWRVSRGACPLRQGLVGRGGALLCGRTRRPERIVLSRCGPRRHAHWRCRAVRP